MEHESQMLIPRPTESEKVIVMPPLDQPTPPAHTLAADPEQNRAVEALFAAQEQENKQVEGLLGMWLGAAILKDLVTDGVTEEPDDGEQKEDKPEEG
jgi:hypothetical protein